MKKLTTAVLALALAAPIALASPTVGKTEHAGSAAIIRVEGPSPLGCGYRTMPECKYDQY